MENYFKKGARIKTAVRVALIEAAKPAPKDNTSEAYAIAIRNINRSWARRWMRAHGHHSYA